MMSSAPRLNVLVELVTNDNITDSSTPELASLTISDTGPDGRIAGGTGLPVWTGLAGASEISVVGAGSAGLLSSAVTVSATVGDLAADASAVPLETGAGPGDSGKQMPGISAKFTPSAHFQKLRLFIWFQ